MFRKLLDLGEAGDNVGCLLRGIEREGVERGQVLAKPGSVTPHTHFKAEAYILTKDEGGRHTPFFTNYRPQFYFRTTDVTGVCHLPEGTEMVMPGDNVTMDVELIVPIAMEEKLRFAIREGGRTVGCGRRLEDCQINRTEDPKSEETEYKVHAKPKHTHQAQGLRSSRARRVDQARSYRRPSARVHACVDPFRFPTGSKSSP